MDISFPVFQFFGACDAQASNNYWNFFLASSFLIEPSLFLKNKTLCVKKLSVKLCGNPSPPSPSCVVGLCVTRSSPFYLSGVPARDLVSMSGLLYVFV